MLRPVYVWRECVNVCQTQHGHDIARTTMIFQSACSRAADWYNCSERNAAEMAESIVLKHVHVEIGSNKEGDARGSGEC
jgi:hypothetical protein